MNKQVKNSRTGKLSRGLLEQMISEVEYRPIPRSDIPAGSHEVPVWRVRLELASDPSKRIGLDINGPITLGRGSEAPGFVDLTPLGAAEQGVSRRHLKLQPTVAHLFAIDLGSTNGTLHNGNRIGINTPHSLANGDILTLGRLRLIVRIVDRPRPQTDRLEPKAELADILLQIAKAITSQLDLNEALNQVAETAVTLTAAGEIGIWLADEATGELLLEAHRGVEDEKIHRLRLPLTDDALVAKVFRERKPLRAERKPGEDQIKINTDYLVESLYYVPIAIGEIPLGVLTATHREGHKRFQEREERLLEAIADFAAITVLNARHYQATDKALERRIRELAALNELTRAVSSSLDLDRVYEVLTEQMNKHWPAETVRLLLLDEEHNKLLPFPFKDLPAGTAYPVGMGIVGRVVERGEGFFTNAAQNHPSYDSRIDGMGESPPQSIAAVPLRVKGRVVGALCLYNKYDGTFTQDDLSRLEAFANPVAAAIENARLFAEAERRQAVIQATAHVLSQPLLIVDEEGQVIVANKAASETFKGNYDNLLKRLGKALGTTTQMQFGKKAYLVTAEHAPGTGTIVVMQDITYVKRLEKDRANLMEVLSHDLKSLLQSIQGWAQLVRRMAKLEKREKGYIDEIIASVDRMLNMINDSLEALERTEVLDLVRKPCDLRAIVDKVLDDVRGAALSKEIKLASRVTGSPYQILGDEGRLYHMILNLVDNAIKYSPRGGQVDVLLDFREAEILLRVQDEGPGIPEEEIERIFDKYYRARNVADTHAGAGLGLSVVQAVARAHEGEVTARSREKKGAEFTVWLPASLRVEEKQPMRE